MHTRDWHGYLNIEISEWKLVFEYLQEYSFFGGKKHQAYFNNEKDLSELNTIICDTAAHKDIP
jgi:hypothetical protein